MGQIQATINEVDFIDNLTFISDNYNIIKNINLNNIPIDRNRKISVDINKIFNLFKLKTKIIFNKSNLEILNNKLDNSFIIYDDVIQSYEKLNDIIKNVNSKNTTIEYRYENSIKKFIYTTIDKDDNYEKNIINNFKIKVMSSNGDDFKNDDFFDNLILNIYGKNDSGKNLELFIRNKYNDENKLYEYINKMFYCISIVGCGFNTLSTIERLKNGDKYKDLTIDIVFPEIILDRNNFKKYINLFYEKFKKNFIKTNKVLVDDIVFSEKKIILNKNKSNFSLTKIINKSEELNTINIKDNIITINKSNLYKNIKPIFYTDPKLSNKFDLSKNKINYIFKKVDKDNKLINNYIIKIKNNDQVLYFYNFIGEYITINTQINQKTYYIDNFKPVEKDNKIVNYEIIIPELNTLDLKIDKNIDIYINNEPDLVKIKHMTVSILDNIIPLDNNIEIALLNLNNIIFSLFNKSLEYHRNPFQFIDVYCAKKFSSLNKINQYIINIVNKYNPKDINNKKNKKDNTITFVPNNNQLSSSNKFNIEKKINGFNLLLIKNINNNIYIIEIIDKIYFNKFRINDKIIIANNQYIVNNNFYIKYKNPGNIFSLNINKLINIKQLIGFNRLDKLL